MPLLFENQLIVIPQTVSVVKDQGLIAASAQNPVTVAIIGTAKGGQPNYAYEFFSAQDARARFISGLLPDAIDMAYQPGEGGASRVIGVRLNGDLTISNNLAARATKNLSDGSATTIVLTAAEWGVEGNNLAIAIADGTDGAPTKKITVYWKGSEIVGDNIGRLGLSVLYSGSGGTGTTVAVSSTALTTAATGDAAAVVTLPFSTYDTLQKLADALNATGSLTATVTGPDPGAASGNLDILAATSTTTAASLRQDLAAQLAFFASLGIDILTAAEHGTPTGKPAANVTKTFFTGGVDPTITNPSWQAALDVVANENVQIVVVLSSDATIHAMLRTHVETQSGISQKGERRGIVGGPTGTTVAQAKGAALALNSDRVQYVYPGLQQEGLDGTLTAVPPYMVAAMLAGMSAGLPPANAKTYRFVKAAGIETRLSRSSLETLLQQGVCPIRFVQGQGYQVVQDLTTWLKDTRLNRREFSMGLALDQVSKRLRAVGDTYIGRPAGPALSSTVSGALSVELRKLEGEGVIVGDAAHPAFRALSVSLIADQVRIQVEVAIAAPANYISIEITPTVYSGVA